MIITVFLSIVNIEIQIIRFHDIDIQTEIENEALTASLSLLLNVSLLWNGLT